MAAADDDDIILVGVFKHAGAGWRAGGRVVKSTWELEGQAGSLSVGTSRLWP
jgi:hypothetical protein